MTRVTDDGQHDRLARRLGLPDAVVLGLAAMVGAGVFAAIGPAARAAGSALLIGLAVAAVVAYCNATASAQLAAMYPVSGGTYVYGRERLGPGWGFLAGWGFVVGKTASCAAMALTFATYAVPDHRVVQRAIAVAGVVVLTAANYRGVTRTALLSRILVALTLVALAVIVLGIWLGSASVDHIRSPSSPHPGGVLGVLQSAGLLFFAFAGYARIATMGEEVRDPARTIPRAINAALAGALAIYAIVAISALAAAGPHRLAHSADPLATAVGAAGNPSLAPLVRIGAAVASLGALLALIAGVGRTVLAMARNGDLPRRLAAVHPRFHVPHRAELVLAVVVCATVITADLRNAIGFSSFGVLVYYAIANAAAYTQPTEQRRHPRWLNVVGIAGCLVLVATLPLPSVAAGLAVFAIGLAGRVAARRRMSGGVRT
ncbi:MAG TPA: APC family permease [Jatrophihabitantaceae bacterium]|nr:APC family permease [Jatrophihabitantaceae bacterium]